MRVYNRLQTGLCVVTAAFLSSFLPVYSQGGNTNFTETLNGTGLDMVFVQGGAFQMGCTAEQGSGCESNEKPVHSVTVSDFYLSKYEVTQKQWAAVMGSKTAVWANDNAPVTMVSWYDANDFICELNKKTGKKYRLATEAEWEFAARGGTQSKGYVYSGSNTASEVAQINGSVQNVGGKAPNELGLYDMSGNVWELVYDTYGAYSEEAQTNPTGPASLVAQPVRRGGAYDEGANVTRVSYRRIRSRDGADGMMGFRLALSSSNSFPAGMVAPCDVERAEATQGENSLRDSRLFTDDGTVWVYDMSAYVSGMAYVLFLKSNGAAILTMLYNGMSIPQASGEWYTANDFSLNIVSTGATRTTTKFAYMLVNNNEMSIISESSLFGRFTRKSVSEVSGASGVTVPTISNPTPLAQLVPAGAVVDMSNPPINQHDSRLIEGPDYAWLQDNVALGAGGAHRYRFDFDTPDTTRFVVYQTSSNWSNILATGKWYTIGNTFLRIVRGNYTYDYLYTVTSNGNTFYHISYQGYEIGDFRIFTKETNAHALSVAQWIEPNGDPYFNNPAGGSTYVPPSLPTGIYETTPVFLQSYGQDEVVYYNMQGQSIGNTKPKEPGIYLVKNIKTGQVQKIVVRQ